MANHAEPRMINIRTALREKVISTFHKWVNGEASTEALLGILGAYEKREGYDVTASHITNSILAADEIEWA